MKLVMIDVHWINPEHVTNVSPEEWPDGSKWTQIDLVTGTGILLEGRADLTVGIVAQALNDGVNLG